MKIKPDHIAHMRAVMIETLKRWPTAEEYAARGIGKNFAKRHRWDVFHASGLSHYACDVLYEYANDDHIDTAIRQIVEEWYSTAIESRTVHIDVPLATGSGKRLTKAQQRRLACELIETLRNVFYEAVAKAPATWDGIELRYLLADLFREGVVYPMDAERHRRYLAERHGRDI